LQVWVAACRTWRFYAAGTCNAATRRRNL